jgi:hypothetical protein
VVAGLVTRGLTNREITDELVISVKTVERHPGTVFVKLGVSNRMQLVAAVAGYRHAVPVTGSVEYTPPLSGRTLRCAEPGGPAGPCVALRLAGVLAVPGGYCCP